MEKIQKTAETLVEIAIFRAKNESDKLAFAFLENGEKQTSTFTYQALDTRARSIAAQLQSMNLQNERALLIYESGPDYLDSFFGCLYSGIISVPLHPPGKNKSLSRISAIANDSGAKVILSTEEIKKELEKDFAADEVLKNLDWITTETISNDNADKWNHPDINSGTLAYLQYTSGSTGTPKGVMVNHRNLIHNINIIDKSHPHAKDSVMVTWLPIHHDMGLIYGMLLPFVCGYPCYYMTPQAFVQKPLRWLEAISKYKGTHNAAPNFAFELCVNKISPEQKKTLDLSSWKVAMNASEPVRAETITRFADYFNECGFEEKYFCPGYGLAEGTLILSANFKDSELVKVRFNDNELEKNNKAVTADENDFNSKVHIGHSNSIEDTRIAIVNPVTLIECAEGEVGEIWSSGISIAQGYWKRADATEETFRAFIKDTNEGPFLRTGDLGFIKNNELYITGRHKDLIIVRGQNHYPQDIEYTVESSHPCLRLGCVGAFAMDVEGEEHVGIVQEIQKNFVNDFDLDEVVKSIRKAVSEEHDLQVYSITLIQPGTIPKTSSGKIQRGACRQGVEEGTLDVIARWNQKESNDSRNKSASKQNEKKFIVNITNLREWLINRVSNLLFVEKDKIDINEPFAAYGMDSLKAVQLSGDLEALLQKELPATLVYDYPSIKLLSNFLSKDFTAENKIENKIENNDFKTGITSAGNEPIAIIGIGLNFPGAKNVNEFWNNLSEGKDSIRQIPESRWDKNSLNESTVTFGGFLDDADKFDPIFFGISPREAIQIDPQQRISLEVAWHALEDAGINPETLAGKNVGTFMGICTYDYARFSAGKKELFDVYTGTGTSLSISANRISYFLDLRGPSIAIDTACSSSLVALHLACKSLNDGESVIALAGGVNLLLTSDWNVVFTEADMLAPDGHCKTFDADADGYVRSEGCGIVVLKKLSDALKDGDRIYSIIKGSAVNQDGRSNGLTAPNGPSQEEVINIALKNANVKPEEINYVEAHGTGTPLGDPIEVNSLAKVLDKNRTKENLLYIGSVKTNIGHLEAAAGIAGVIKTSLALYYKEIPKHLNYKKLNPEILLDGKNIEIADKKIKWENKKRLAGVSSFGFGGTNAHLILQSPPDQVFPSNKKTLPLNIFTLTARNDNALSQLAERYVSYLDNNKSSAIDEICFNANTNRAIHNHRISAVCSSKDDLIKKLGAFLKKKNDSEITSGTIKPNHFPKVAFLFPGQGAQFIGMGKELYDTSQLFRNTINKCDEILRSYLDKSLLEVLFYEKDESLNPINETTYTQPALFAIEYALAKLWMSWGIVPSVMMGHSAGEYVAACLAGVFSLEDGLKLVTERGRLMQTMTAEGEMFTVFAEEEKVKKFINGFEDLVSVASINGPFKTVISGDKNSLSKIIPKLDENKIEFKKINVSIASHSPLMNPMIDEFRKVCKTVNYSSPQIPVVSNITGEIVTDKISNADYWCEHILSGVRFSDGIKACINFGCEFFIDLGPKPTSISMGQETVQDSHIHWLPSIKYNFSIWETMLHGLGTMFVNGVVPDWKNFYKDWEYKKISLPVYPFQHQRYWIEDLTGIRKNSPLNFSSQNSFEKNPLAGFKLPTASKNEFIFSAQISGNKPDYLENHCVFNKIIFPGAAYIEMALSSLSEITSKDYLVSDISFHQALILEKDSMKNVQTILRKESIDSFSFEIFGLEENNEDFEWILHASGKLNAASKLKKFSMPEEFSSVRNIFDDSFYTKIENLGIEYKNEFQGIKEFYLNGNRALSKIAADKKLSFSNYKIHPVILDCCFQTAINLCLNNSKGKALIPVNVGEVYFNNNPGEEIWCEAESHPIEGNSIHNVSLRIFSKDKLQTGYVKNLKLKELSRQEFEDAVTEFKDWFYEVKWEKKKPAYNGEKIDIKLSALMKSLDLELNELSEENKLSNFKKDIDEVNEQSVRYIIGALKKLGVNVEPDKTFSKSELAKDINISGRHMKLFYRLFEILEERKILNIDGDNFKFATDYKANAVTGNANQSAESMLLQRCGEKLAEVLTGKAEGLQLVFSDGNHSVTNLYTKSPGFVVMNDSIKSLIKEVTKNLSDGTKIRILEIGAGTGATTSSVISALPADKSQYTFTDVSQLFLSDAKEKFGKFDFIDFQILDAEKEISTQGFEENIYDIVIASNVVHATKNLKETVSNIRKLLAPGGILILNEVTSRQSWIDLTFGYTDGWWRFEDTDLRKTYPLLSDNQWSDFILNNGFAEVEIFSPSQKENSWTGQSLIISKADAKNSQENLKTVIFANGETGSKLKDFIKSKKQNAVIVTEGKNFSKISQNEFEINYDNSKDYEKLFKELSAGGKLKVVYLSPNSGKKISGKLIESTAENGFGNFIKLVRSIAKNNFEFTPRLFIVTVNSIQVNDVDSCEGIADSPLNGIGKVISLELPEFKRKNIDIDDETDFELLFDEFNFPDDEEQTAFRKNERYCARLRKKFPSRDKNILPDKAATYLITGGLSGLGILTAKFLIDKGARHIALIGRREKVSEAEPYLEEFKLKGADVKIYKADVTNKQDLEKIIKEISGSDNPLKGIIHSAGLLDDGTILNQNEEKFKKVISPKILGAWYLHELTKDMSLDFFIMYSSVASLLGSAGQSNHSAANSFLDALAGYRRRNGLEAASINWGVWSEIGSAAAADADKNEKVAGIGTINPRQGIHCLEKAMMTDVAQIGIFPMDWKKYYQRHKQRFVEKLIRDDIEEISQNENSGEKEEFILKLKSAPEEKHSELLINFFKKLISGIIKIEEEELETDLPLNMMGLDSLMAIELKNKVNMQLGVDLNLVRYMEETSIASLAEELKTQIPKILSAANAGQTPQNGSSEISEEDKTRELLANLEDLSEEELDKLLNETK